MRLVEESGQKLKVFINLIVLVFALYGASRRDYTLQKASAFESLMIDIIAPMQRSVDYFKDNISYFFTAYVTNVNATREKLELKSKVELLQNELFQYQEIKLENERLKDLLKFDQDNKYNKVLAQIIAWDSSSDFKVIRINKGRDNGVKELSTVVTSQGLVGYVNRVSDNHADILTIIDPRNNIDGTIQRTRSFGIIEGIDERTCRMKHVNRTDPVILNDVVITSGLGGIYPKGIKIGAINKIERETYGITQKIEIKPSVDFSKLEEVAVLTEVYETVSEEIAGQENETTGAEVLKEKSDEN